MTEDDVGELLDALLEHFSAAELEDASRALKRLKYYLGFEDPVLRALLTGVREIKNLRGDTKPFWAQCLQEN